MTVLRVAARLAFSRDRRQRWRQGSVILGAFLSTLLLAGALAAVGASAAADKAMTARSPVWAPSPQGSTLNVSLRGLTVDGTQFPVVWLDPVAGHESDAAVVPPGLRRLPGAGEGVLSPGLAAKGYTAADFGLKPSTAGTGPGFTIGDDGVATMSEGFLYVRPAAGRTLGQGGALLPTGGYRSDGGRANLEASPDIVSVGQMALGVLLLLVLPGVLLVVNVARASSRTRAHRAGILTALGVDRTRVVVLLAVETAALAAVGAALATITWLLVGNPAQHVPLSGAVLIPNALHLGIPALLGVAAAVVASAAGAGSFPEPHRRKVRRPRMSARSGRVVSQLLFAGSLLVMAASRWLSPESPVRQRMLFLGLFGVALGIPLALPALCAWLGSFVGSLRSPRRWLGGRRLTHHAALVARPAAAVGLLVLFAGSAFALYGRLGVVEPDTGSNIGFSRFIVEWRDTQTQDFPKVVTTLTPLTTLPFTADDSGQRAHLTCDTNLGPAQPLLPTVCETGALSPQFAAAFEAATSFKPEIGPPPQEPSGYLVLAPKGTQEISVMRPLAGVVPGLNINQVGSPDLPWAGVGWVVTGWAVGSAVLTLLLVREIGERVHRTSRADLTPQGLGLTEKELASVQRWSLYPPALVAVLLGYAGAVVFALYGYQLGITVNYLGRITAVSVATGVLATVSVALASHADRSTAGDRRAAYD